MKLFDIFINTRFNVLQGENVDIKNLTIDSRTVRNGSLFFCIRGLKNDGHKFVHTAAEQHAAAIVVDKILDSWPKGITILKVEDSRIALAYAATNFYGRPDEHFNLIGVTGTNGKTSTTYFMEAILNEYKHKTGIIGTVQSRIGDEKINILTATSTTPDTIELYQILNKMREEKVDDVIMEVTSHALALDKVEGMRFGTAIFTNLTQDHLDFHGTMDEYRQAKAKLFKMCDKAVINADDDASTYMIEGTDCKVITYSIDKESDLKAYDIKFLDNGVRFNIKIKENTEEFFAPVPGRFSVYNTLGVIGAALSMKIPIDIIKSGLKNLKGIPGRIQSIPNELGIYVIVDYAHTPDGLKNVISSVREFTTGRLIIVFGCGGDRDKLKRPIMGEIAGVNSDYCVITSDNPRTENPEAILNDIEPAVIKTGCQYIKLVDRKEAIEHAIGAAHKGDSVIIAGKGHENYQIFADRTVYFDDSEIAQNTIGFLKD